LDSLRGQVVIVDFWATWCTPCRTEFELLEKWWDDEQRTGLLDSVVVLAVNTGEDRAVVEQFLASNEIPFRVVLDEDGGVAQAYRVQALPTLMIIDHDGNVADVQVGLDPAIGGSLSMWLKNRDKRERR
jgi:thiol-disulfide isomerase/thioredoxin